jgi:hypothetical protein
MAVQQPSLALKILGITTCILCVGKIVVPHYFTETIAGYFDLIFIAWMGFFLAIAIMLRIGGKR